MGIFTVDFEAMKVEECADNFFKMCYDLEELCDRPVILGAFPGMGKLN